MSAATKRVQLSFIELHQLKWVLGELLTIVSLWTIFFLEIRSGPLLAVTIGAIIAVICVPSLPGRIPSWVWVAVTPALIVVIVADFYLSRPDVIPSLVRMVVLLVLVRCLQYRRKREDQQLILLCLFMVVISGVLTLSLEFGIQLLMFTPLAMACLFIVNLVDTSEDGGELPEGLWDNFRWGHFLDRVWQAQDFRLLALAVLFFVGVVGVSSLIFITMPRFRLDQAIPFFQLNSRKSKSGFSDKVQFGEVVEIIEDDSVALRVDMENREEAPDIPYWRMVVLDEYYKNTFQMSLSARKNNKVFSDVEFGSDFQPQGFRQWSDAVGSAGKWTFYLEGGISKYLPRVGPSRGLRFQTRKNIEFNYTLRLLATKNISSRVLFYQYADVYPAENFGIAPEEWKLATMKTIAVDMNSRFLTSNLKYPQTTLAVPAGEGNQESLTRIVGEITHGETLPAREFSDRAVKYLQERHYYSLSSVAPQGDRDIMVRWMDSNEPGHCELFAGAFTLLARMAGHPTRIITGFKGGTWNGFENYYMVRNRDAHAWCEVFDGDKTWFRVDPTPGSGREDSFGAAARLRGLTIDRTWRAYIDSLRILWYRRIVDFDREQQKAMAGQLKNWGTATLDTLKVEFRDLLDNIRSWISGPWDVRKYLKLLRNLGVAVGIWALIRWSPKWISRLGGGTGRLFGFRLARDPVRKKAGKFVGKFRARPSGSAPLAEHWDLTYRDLLNLRYGDGFNRPDHRIVFRQARMILKEKSTG